jgi:hypothetical protein
MNDATPSLDTPAVHPTYLRLLCQTLRGQGVDVDPLIRAAGLGAWTDLAGRDALVEHRAVNSLIRECLRASGKAWLGLELGAAVQASAHGPMGYAAIASRDLGQALEVVARYVPTRNAAFRFRLRDTKDGVAFELIERIDLEDARDFITSMVFVTILRLMEAVVGQPMSAVEVDLPFPEPPCSRIRA